MNINNFEYISTFNMTHNNYIFIINDKYDRYKFYECSPITLSTGFTKLMFYIIKKQYNNAKKELKKYPECIDIKNDKGWTALMIACRNSNIYGECFVKLLLDNGADVNLYDNNGRTALMKSVRNMEKDSTENTIYLLLNNGADINVIDYDGWSILMISIKYIKSVKDTIKIIKILLEKGIFLNYQRDIDGYNALMLACRYREYEVIDFLLDYDIDINLEDNNGKNAIIIYLQLNTNIDDKIIKTFIEKGVYINCNQRDLYLTIKAKNFYKKKKEERKVKQIQNLIDQSLKRFEEQLIEKLYSPDHFGFYITKQHFEILSNNI